MSLKENIEKNIWDHIKDVVPAINNAIKGDWCWALNSKCKYVTVKIDMRDGGCLLMDREGNRIDIEGLEYQYKGTGRRLTDSKEGGREIG